MTGDRDRSDADIATAVDESAPPIQWSELTAEEAEQEWPALRAWVNQLQRRFPHTLRLPTCWWQHNDLVELLAALRDHERASFGPSAPPTAAIEWHRAFRDTEVRAETWIRRLGCSVPGREHPDVSTSDAWQHFIEADVQSRALPDEPN
jgi:hypothetical protein